MSKCDDSAATDELIAQLVLEGKLPRFGPDKVWEEERVRVRAPNKKRRFKKSEERFERLYFWDYPVHDDKDFERRFRMPSVVFNRVMSAVDGKSIFRLRHDVTNRRGISPRMRVIDAFRVPAYGKAFDEVDEIVEISQILVRNSFFAFVDIINKTFGKEYLRTPAESEFRRIISIKAGGGFSNCIGSWKNARLPGRSSSRAKRRSLLLSWKLLLMENSAYGDAPLESREV